MERDATKMRGSWPSVVTKLKNRVALDLVILAFVVPLQLAGTGRRQDNFPGWCRCCWPAPQRARTGPAGGRNRRMSARGGTPAAEPWPGSDFDGMTVLGRAMQCRRVWRS
jgi:hypothetical protein